MNSARLKTAFLACCLSAGALLVACDNGDSGSGQAPTATPPPGQLRPIDGGGAVATGATGAQAPSPQLQAPVAVQLSDDSYLLAVGEAGKVEIVWRDGRLSLLDVRTNDGWSYRIDDEDDDEIELDFRGTDGEIELEVAIDGGRVEVDTKAKHRNARDGVWQAGDAAEVEFRVEDGRLVLLDVRPNAGWSHRVEDEKRDELKLKMGRDRDEVEFKVKLDKGNVEIEIKSKSYVSQS